MFQLLETLGLSGRAETVASKIEDLLFETLLVNYSGDLAAYLRTVGKSDKAYAGVRRRAASQGWLGGRPSPGAQAVGGHTRVERKAQRL